MNMTVALKKTKDDRFTIGASASFAFDTTSTKEGFVNFYLSLKRRLKITIFNQALSYFRKISINCVAIQGSQTRDLRGV